MLRRLGLLLTTAALALAVIGVDSSSASAYPYGEILVSVVGPDGQPLRGVCLAVFTQDPDGDVYGNGCSSEGVSDDDPGSYLIRVETGVKYWVLATGQVDDAPFGPGPDVAPQYYPDAGTFDDATPVVVRYQSTPLKLTMQMQPAAHVAGTVTTPDGRALTDAALVTATPTTDPGLPTETSTVDAGGHYDIARLGSAAYRISVTDGGDTGYDVAPFAETYSGDVTSAAAATPVMPTPGETSREDVHLQPNGTLSGTVTGPDGTAVAGAHVTIDADGPQGDPLVLTTDGAGHYDAHQLRARTYDLDVSDPSRLLAEQTTRAAVSPGQATTADLQLDWAPAGFPEGLTIAPSGTAVHVGDVLSLQQSPSPSTAKESVQWLRLGEPIPGETDPTYTVTAEDLEDQEPISARVTLINHGVTSVVTSSSVDDVSGGAFTTVPTPTISDTTPAYLEVLHATEAAPSPAVTSAGWQWLRDGKAISGATSSTYRATAADAAHHLTVRYTARRDGYVTVARTSAETSAPHTTHPTVVVAASSTGSGKVAVTVHVTSADITAGYLDGTVVIDRVRTGSDRLTTAKLVDGVAHVTLTGQPKGSRTYYAGLVARPHVFLAATSPHRTVSVR